MGTVTILIPAAGAASRMRGGDKLLEQVEGRPLLAVMVDRALATGQRVIVALPGPDHPRAAALAGSAAEIVFVADADQGMGHSLRAAAHALAEDCAAAMILPADMPELTSRDLTKMLEAWAETPANAILRGAGADGRPGHPVVIPALHFAALRSLTGDQGARTILAAHPGQVRLVPLPARHALTDLDTPEDWAAWREGQTG